MDLGIFRGGSQYLRWISVFMEVVLDVLGGFLTFLQEDLID